MTPEEFDNLPSIKKLLKEGNYGKASSYAALLGTRTKDDELRAYSNVLLAEAKELRKAEADSIKDMTNFSEYRF